MINCIFVGLGGFIGSVCRYLIGRMPLPVEEGFPVRTLMINILGAFLIGLIAAAATKNGTSDSPHILFLKVGICGGFTTFSSFSLESSNLLVEGKMAQGIVYMVLSVTLCLAAVTAGKYLIKA